MNPLDEYPKARKYFYMLQWIVNLITGAIGVALIAMEESPLWFIVTTAVLNFVWTYAGRTAQQNTRVIQNG